VGTSFFNQGWEGRLEFLQRDRGGWQGAFGGQFFIRDLNIIGAEKFLPEANTTQFGVFTVQSLDLGAVRAEAGGRIESTRQTAKADSDLGTPDYRRSFTAYSGSLGANYELAEHWRVGINASYTQRAPSAEELFANGPHAGTQAFEVGDPPLAKEKSKGLELLLRGKGGNFSVTASLYHSWFNGFIYETATGLIEDDLPVFQISQGNARHYGAEIEASFDVAQIGDYAISLDGVGDYSRAKLTGGAGNLPRIPALRLLGGLEAKSDTVTARIETEWVNGQKRVAAFETTTPGYTMVNASVNFKPLGKDKGLDLTLSANNIFDVVARRHASFMKDYAPLTGRDIRLTARISF
jgi:iron complex outermembrane receptor protein